MLFRSDLPAIDPPGKGRVMTHDDLTSTSNCIGNPITPLCSVETAIACFVRRDNELCRIAKGLDKSPRFFRSEPSPNYYERYRVLSAKRFGEHDLPPRHHLSPSATPAPWWFPEDRQIYQPGDMHIVVLRQTCWRNPDRCDPVWNTNRKTFHLRRINDHWAVLIWTSPDQRYEKFEDKREKF